MNKIFSFEKDKDKLKIVVKNDGEVINTFVFNDTSISAEQIFNLFSPEEGDNYSVDSNPFDKNNDSLFYNQANMLIELLNSIIQEISKIGPIENDCTNSNKSIDEQLIKSEKNISKENKM